MLCFTATQDDDKAEQYQTCELFILAKVPAQGQAYLKVEACDPDAQGAAVPTKKMGRFERIIGNAAYNIKYTGQDDQDRATFRLKDYYSSEWFNINFSLKFYNPYVGKDSDSSGAYTFRLGEDMSKHMYSKFEGFEIYKTANLDIHCFVGYYRDEKTGQMYTFVLRLLPDVPEAIEWDVLLHGIPISDG